ncbi:MAG: hypothetical protein JJD97_14020 [Gemmatimonadaceae bacterium]|nr:hypothetical protein [Gemmatimonadaceae bacterium]
MLVLANGAAAQIRVELGASVGLYSPLGSFQPASVYSMALPNGPDQLSGSAVGGELRLWIVPRIGVELAGATSSSSVGGGNTPEGYAPSTPARVSTGTAQLLFRVTREESRMRMWLGAGAGAVQHGGKAYDAFGNPVNYGGVLGVGGAMRLSGGLSADFGVTSMIYHLNIRGTPATDVGLSERGRQVDLVLRTGLSYGWR